MVRIGSQKKGKKMNKLKIYKPNIKLAQAIQFDGKNYDEVLEALKTKVVIKENTIFSQRWNLIIYDGKDMDVLSIKTNDYIVFKKDEPPMIMEQSTFLREYKELM